MLKTKSIKCKREGKEGFGIRDISCFQKFIFSLRSKFICGNTVHFLSILSFNFNQPFVWEMVLNQGLSIYPSSRCFASKKKVFIIVVWYCISQGIKKRKKFGSVLPSDEKTFDSLTPVSNPLNGVTGLNRVSEWHIYKPSRSHLLVSTLGVSNELLVT